MQDNVTPENMVLKPSGPPRVTALHPVLAKSNKRIFSSSKELLHPEFSCQIHMRTHTLQQADCHCVLTLKVSKPSAE